MSKQVNRSCRTAVWSALALLIGGGAQVAQAADDLSKPLRISPDGRFFMQADGAPFFWLGDTGWSLFQRLDREDAEQYLKDRASRGYTVIQAVVFGGPADSIDAKNRYGHTPFLNRDVRRPNPKYFEHVDWIVERAAQLGLRVGMLPTWGAGTVGGWVGAAGKVFTPATAESYGRWLAERYRNKGVIWILGGDTNPVGVGSWSLDKTKRDNTIFDYRPIWDAMGKGIVAGEGGKPIITYHITCCSWSGTAEPRTSLYFADREWLTVNMLQSSHFRDPQSVIDLTGVNFAWEGAYNYEPIRAEYDSLPTKPIVDGEPRYEDLVVDVESEPKLIERKGYWNAYDVRNAAYHAVFAGAAGHTYGNHSVWQFYDPKHFKPVQAARVELPWQKAIVQPGADQMQHVRALMLSRPYFTRIPDQSLVLGDQGRGEAHIGATRDRLGSYAMLFVPKGQTVTADLSKLSGLRAVAWWFDPRTGAATRIEGSFPTTGAATFVPPTSGADADWILVLDDESKGFAPPGAKS
jgi:hypothetical protein